MQRGLKTSRGGVTGFTLIELMIVVAIVAILASIAMPSYESYIRKQKIRAAQADLSGLVLQLENNYVRTLSYPSTTTTTAATQTTFPGWSPAEVDFVYTISASGTASYTLQAVGQGRVAGCTLTINQANTRTGPGCNGFNSWL